MKKEIILQKLDFAHRRLEDMQSLNSGNFAGAPASDKHQLAQEFFFHLLGAVEYTAQYVNYVLKLNIEPDKVTTKKVIKELENLDAYSSVGDALECLYINLQKNRTMPENPYSSYGLVYRAYNYRHQVTHRGLNPFIYQDPFTTPVRVSLKLDPRDDPAEPSRFLLFKDLDAMLELFSNGCRNVIQLVEEQLNS